MYGIILCKYLLLVLNYVVYIPLSWFICVLYNLFVGCAEKPEIQMSVTYTLSEEIICMIL